MNVKDFLARQLQAKGRRHPRDRADDVHNSVHDRCLAGGGVLMDLRSLTPFDRRWRLPLATAVLVSGAACATIPAPIVMPFADGQHWVLREPLTYRIGDTSLSLTVPAGFVTDFASIPRPLWAILPPTNGRYNRAAVIHDFLYWDQNCTREQADRLLLQGMIESGVSRAARLTIYNGVRAGGQVAWISNADDRRRGNPRIVPSNSRIPDDADWLAFRRTLFDSGVRAEPLSAGIPAPYCSAVDAIGQ